MAITQSNTSLTPIEPLPDEITRVNSPPPSYDLIMKEPTLIKVNSIYEEPLPPFPGSIR